MNYGPGQYTGQRHTEKKKSKGYPNYNEQNANSQMTRPNQNYNRQGQQNQYVQQPNFQPYQQPNLQQYQQQPNPQENVVLSVLNSGPQNFNQNTGQFSKNGGGKRNQQQRGQQMGPNFVMQNQQNPNFQQVLISPSGENTTFFQNPKSNQMKETSQFQGQSNPNKFSQIPKEYQGNMNAGTGIISQNSGMTTQMQHGFGTPNMGGPLIGTSPMYQNQPQFFPYPNNMNNMQSAPNLWVGSKQGTNVVTQNFQINFPMQNQIPQQNFPSSTHPKVNIDISTAPLRQNLSNITRVEILLRFPENTPY